jgi:4-cresol dehydrogenase (hydroxylating)
MKESLLKIFGRQRCLVNKEQIETYGRNIYGIQKHISAVVFPKSELEVKKLIQFATTTKTPLYPLSTGKNFGLGSNLPIQDRQIVVDFHRMNKILEFDSKNGFIRIQPGVTQFQVYQFLKNREAKFRLNVTGGPKDSSLIGNALERGVAHYGPRTNDAIGLELVLGTGKVLKTGGNVSINSKSRMLYRHGIGADLSGLFFQSSFGIVTAATIRLQPIPQVTMAVSINPMPNIRIGKLIEKLLLLRRQGILPTNLHISNRNRKLSVVVPLVARQLNISIEKALSLVEETFSDEWTITTSVCGQNEIVQAQYRLMVKELKTMAKVSLTRLGVDHKKKRKDDYLSHALHEVALNPCGVPSDDSIMSLGFDQHEVFKTDLIESNTGTLFMVPLLPSHGSEIEKAVHIVTVEFSKFGFKPFITLNLIEENCFEAVVNLTFDRRSEGRRKEAMKVMRRTFKQLCKNGFPPARMSIFQMNIPQKIDNGHIEAIQNIKSLFDPIGIISEWRYTLRAQK